MLQILIVIGALAATLPPGAQARVNAARGKGFSVGAAVQSERLAKKPAAKKKADTKVETKTLAAPEEKRAPQDPRATADSAAPADPSARRGMARIEFDDRLIQGQTNKANAIYLFERRQSSLRSLLKKRADFRQEIDETLER